MLYGGQSPDSAVAATSMGGILGNEWKRKVIQKSLAQWVYINCIDHRSDYPAFQCADRVFPRHQRRSVAAAIRLQVMPGIGCRLFLMIYCGHYWWKSKSFGWWASSITVVLILFWKRSKCYLLVVVIGGIIGGVFTATEKPRLLRRSIAFWFYSLIYREIGV